MLYDLIIMYSCLNMTLMNRTLTLSSLSSLDQYLLTIQYSSVILILCIYLKVLSSLSIIKWIGIYTIIVGKVVKELSVFLFIFISVLFTLALCFNSLFKLKVSFQSTLLSSLLQEILAPLGMLELLSQDDISSSPVS